MQHSDWWKMTGPIKMTKTSRDYRTQTWHGIRESKCGIYPGSFSKTIHLSFQLVVLKHEQEKAVNCLSEGRDVFVVMPTGYGRRLIFQLFATAVMIKKVRWRATLRYCSVSAYPLTSIIQDQVKEGKSLGSDCAVILSKICPMLRAAKHKCYLHN